MTTLRDVAAAADLAALRRRASLLEPHLTVIRPDGAGPFPVVVQMHGCGGRLPLQEVYAEAARAAGVAVVIVDSFAPRDIGRREALLTVCTGARLRGAERAFDLVAMLHWLRGQAWADDGRLAAAGWSHGAWAVMEAMVAARARPATADLVRSVKLVLLFYPYAGPLARTAAGGWGDCRPAVFACLAGRDAVVGRVGPRRAIERLRADGLDVDLLDLAEATHAFDDEQAADPRTRHRPDLAARARAAYVAALRETLLAPGVGA